MGQELTTISEQAADAQIKSYFDYYSEDIEEIRAYQSEALESDTGFNLLLKKMRRLIMKGIVSIEIGASGAEIVQRVFHNKSLDKLCYAALNGEASIAIVDLGGVQKMNVLLGKLSGVGADGIKGLVGQDYKNAGTVYAFLTLL